MSRLRPVLIATLTTLVALFAGVFLFERPVHAQSLETQEEIRLDILTARPILEHQSQLVYEKMTEVEREAQATAEIEELKASLSDDIETLKEQLKELRQKVAEKKAREERARIAAAREAERKAELARRQALTQTYSFSSVGNTYGYGYCTWHVKNMRPDLPNSLGNANTWFYRAQLLGLPTGTTPKAGAVGTSERGALGHVVYVRSVNGDGTINISDMNYGGWNVITYRTVDASQFRYIY